MEIGAFERLCPSNSFATSTLIKQTEQLQHPIYKALLFQILFRMLSVLRATYNMQPAFSILISYVQH